jgi:hypothetical protein
MQTGRVANEHMQVADTDILRQIMDTEQRRNIEPEEIEGVDQADRGGWGE